MILLTWKRGRALKAQLARIAPDGDMSIEVTCDRRALFPQLARLADVSIEEYYRVLATLQRQRTREEERSA